MTLPTTCEMFARVLRRTEWSSGMKSQRKTVTTADLTYLMSLIKHVDWVDAKRLRGNERNVCEIWITHYSALKSMKWNFCMLTVSKNNRDQARFSLSHYRIEFSFGLG